MKTISKNKNHKNFMNDKKSATWPPTPISLFCFSIAAIRATIQHYCSITCVGTLSLYPIWAVFAYTIIFIATVIYPKRTKRIKAFHFFRSFFLLLYHKIELLSKFLCAEKNINIVMIRKHIKVSNRL